MGWGHCPHWEERSTDVIGLDTPLSSTNSSTNKLQFAWRFYESCFEGFCFGVVMTNSSPAVDFSGPLAFSELFLQEHNDSYRPGKKTSLVLACWVVWTRFSPLNYSSKRLDIFGFTWPALGCNVNVYGEQQMSHLSIPRSRDVPHSTVLNSHHLSDLTLMSYVSAAHAICSQGYYSWSARLFSTDIQRRQGSSS